MTALAKYRIVNIDRVCCLPGVPSEHDRAVVYDTERSEPNPLTGAMQPAVVYGGTVQECHRWIRERAGVAS